MDFVSLGDLAQGGQQIMDGKRNLWASLNLLETTNYGHVR